MSAQQPHTVRLLQLPVQVWAASQEHHDELLREFALMTVGQSSPEGQPPAVPVRLLQLVERLTASFGGTGDEQREQLFAAAARGEQVVDELEFVLPAAVGPAAAQLEQLLDEADEYCSAGQHLLTLATPRELRLFRTWYLRQVQDQVAGTPPVPWPDYVAAAGP
jgi:hypothetical protein